MDGCRRGARGAAPLRLRVERFSLAKLGALREHRHGASSDVRRPLRGVVVEAPEPGELILGVGVDG